MTEKITSAKSSHQPLFITVGTIGALFFIFGFVTWLNGILIPYLKISCELTHFQSYLVAFAFYFAYVIMALPSSWMLKKTGLKKGMMIGLFVMAGGALLFVPAAESRTYLLFLSGLFIMGVGLAILQTAANPYITILGPIESAAQRICIMGICNKSAGMVATFLFGMIALSDGDALLAKLETMNAAQKAAELDVLAARVIYPYIGMAIILATIGLLIKISGLPDIDPDSQNDGDEETLCDTRTSIFQFPFVLLGAVAIFFEVGLEIISGDTIISYGMSLGIPISDAKHFTSMTMIAGITGYIIGIIAIPRFIAQEKALSVCAIIGIILSAAAILSPTLMPMFANSIGWQLTPGSIVSPAYLSVLFIALLGMANAIMWPAIWPLAIDGLGRFTRIGSSLLIMACVGGALLPLLYGRLADILNPQWAYVIAVPCYAFIFYYAVVGHKLGKRVREVAPIIVPVDIAMSED